MTEEELRASLEPRTDHISVEDVQDVACLYDAGIITLAEARHMVGLGTREEDRG